MAKRRLNKKLVLFVSVLASMAMVTVSVLMLYQLRNADPARFESLADEAMDKGDYETAVMFYDRAWKRSNDPAHMVKCGDAALEMGNLNLALDRWQKALIADPTLTEARRSEIGLRTELGRLYGDLSSWLGVVESADAMLDSGAAETDADKAFAHHAKGLALTGLESQEEDNPEKGIEQLEKARELDPDNTEYALDLARQYIRFGRSEEGGALLASLASTHDKPSPEASEVYLNLAGWQAATRDFDDADQTITRAVELAGDDSESRRKAYTAHGRFLVQQWVRQDDNEDKSLLTQAVDQFRAAIDVDPQSFEPYLQLSSVYLARLDDPAKAVEVCEERLAREFSRKGVEGARNRSAIFRLNIQASSGSVAMAERAEEPADRDTWFARAEQFLVDARGESPDHPLAHRQEGRLRLAQGRERAALTAFQTADQRYKTLGIVDWEVKKSLAQLHLRQQQPGAAVAVCEAVAGRVPKSDAGFYLIYAQALMDTGQLERALALVDPILVTDPDLGPAKQLKAAILERRGEAGRAGEFVSSPAISAILQAKAHILAGERELALQLLEETHEQIPGDTRLTGTLVAELVRMERFDEAREAIDRATAANPDSVQIKALAAWVDPSLSETERDEMILTAIEQEPDAYERAVSMMDYHFQRNAYAEALEYLRESIRLLVGPESERPESEKISALRSLIRLELNLGFQLDDEAVMSEARDLATKYDVDGARGRTIVGLVHMLHEEWELAADSFRTALDRQPTDAETIGHLGECLLMLGREEQAQDRFEEAIRINPRQASSHRGLARLAKKRGDEIALARHLEMCRRLIPNDPWVKAELLIQDEQADVAGAIERREELFREDPDDLFNLRRLAALCAMEGLTDKADRYYTELLERTPDDRVLITFVASYYRQTGRPEEALKIVEDYVAGKETPEEQSEAMILLATHYVNVRDFDRVEQVLQEAADLSATLEVCKAYGEFYQAYKDDPAAALPWIDKALALADKEDPTERPGLMISRVRCLLDRRVADLDTAEREIDKLLTRNPQDANALLLRSDLRSRRGDADGAVQSLTEYLAFRPDDATALFARARHLLTLGQTGAAIDDLETIRRTNPGALDFRPRLLLADLYKQSGQSRDWLGELEAIAKEAPESMPANTELARAYMSMGRFGDADRIATSAINRASGNPQPVWFRLQGDVASAVGDYGKAVESYRSACEADGFDPSSVMAALGAFADAGDPAAGLSFWEEEVPQAVRTDPTVKSRAARLMAQAGRLEPAARMFREAIAATFDADLRVLRRAVGEVAAAFPSSDPVDMFRRFPGEPGTERVDTRIDAELAFDQGRAAEAVEMLEGLLPGAAGDAERAQLLESMGDMYTALGKAEKAREVYEESLALNEGNWILMNNLAFLLADALEKHEAALPIAERAVKQSGASFTYDTLGWICVGLGDFDRAIAELNQAVRLDPASVESYYHLGEAYRRAGQQLRARAALKRARELAESSGVVAFDDAISTALDRSQVGDAAP